MHRAREIHLEYLLTTLRTALGHPAVHPLPAESASMLARELPARPILDPGAWIAWCTAGLALFDGPRLPTLRDAIAEARRLTLTLAMLQTHGNITQAAAALGTSRKTLRDNLRAVRLYPWPHHPRRPIDCV